MTNQANQIDPLRYIRCTIGADVYALDMSNVFSVQRGDALRRNPGGGLLAGWFPFRQQKIPVFDLAVRLGQKSRGVTSPRVVMLNALPGMEQAWGLMVDQVSEIVTADARAVTPLPGLSPAGSLFHRAVNTESELVLLLEPERIVANPDGADELRAPSLPALRAEPPALVRASNPLRANQLLLFTLSGSTARVNFAISTVQVLEILAPLRLLPVPEAPREILGYVRWRDRAVPVVDWITRMGLPGQVDLRRARMMIVRAGSGSQAEQNYAILVNPGIRILRLPVKYRKAASGPAIPKQLVKGMIEIERQVTVIPDLHEVFQIGAA
jgi:chemotaxis signal transduction protein